MYAKKKAFVKVETAKPVSVTGWVHSLPEKKILGWTLREYVAVMGWALLVTIFAWIFIGYSIQRVREGSPAPLGATIEQKMIVEAAEPKCDDPLSYIRCAGEKLGVPNEDIRTMIRIARCESSMNPRAKNRHSSASGLFQVIASTWYSNDCVGDKWDFKDSTDCAYKLYQKRAFQPWVSSRNCWMERL